MNGNEKLNDILDKMRSNDDSSVEKNENGALEFKFDSGIPKTGLVFEECADESEEAPPEETVEQESSSEASSAGAEPVSEKQVEQVEQVEQVYDEPAENTEVAHDAEAVAEPKIRTVDDEEFIIPETFVITEEFNTPSDDYVSTIWKTYVPRFTEVTENHNYFADNSALKERDARLNSAAKKPVTFGAAAEEKSAPSVVVAEQRSAADTAMRDDPIAELDEKSSSAVIVNVNEKSKDKMDTINVFKFPGEHIEKEVETLTEEEIARRDISNLIGHKLGETSAPVSENTVSKRAEYEEAYEKDYSPSIPYDTVVEDEKEVRHTDAESDAPAGTQSIHKSDANDTSEYNSFSMRDVFKDKFLDKIMAIRLRLVVAAILGIVTLVFENTYLFGVELFANAFISPAAIDACLVAAMALLALPEIAKGLKSLFSGDIVPELSLLLFGIFAFAYSFTMAAVAGEGVRYPLFAFVYAVISTNSIYATYCFETANFSAFRVVSEKGVKSIMDTRLTRTLERENIALDGAVDEYKSKTARTFETTFVSDFFKKSAKRSENTRNNLLLLCVSIGIALVSGIVMFFIGESGVVSGFSTFMLVISLAIPAFSVLSHKLTYKSAEFEALDNESAVVGEKSLYEFSGVDVVAFEDTEVFGQDDVSFKSISLSDRRGDFREAMRKMSSLFSALGGPLCNVFAASLNKKYPAATSVVIEDDGAEGIVDGKRVMAGNVDYMQRHGVKIPLRNESSVGSTRIMYAAEDGELFAKFTVKYAFSEEFALMLAAMRARKMVPLIYTRDFNINNEFMRFLTGDADAIRVMRKYTPAKEPVIYGKISAGMVTFGDKTSAINLLLLSKKYAHFQSNVSVTELLACGVGAVLAVVIALCNMTVALPSFILGVWQIVWSAVLAVLSMKTFTKRKKEKNDDTK